ncbi:MAG: NAD-dependent epimerase/dehydratase family protein, partial [Hyphomonadaceae bacterium]
MTKILITGGAGYIGSHAAWACVDAGYEIVVLDNLSTGVARDVPPNATLIEADIGDRKAVAKALSDHQIAAIMHFAGSI